MRSCLKHWTKPNVIRENTRTPLWPSGLNWFLSNLSSSFLFLFSHHYSSRQDGTICVMFPSRPMYSFPLYFSLLPFSATLPPSYLPILLLSPSFSARLQPVCSELQTPFHHLYFTSPLKDWPHTKLLFKGKKYTRWGVEWGCRVRVHVHIHARGSPYERSNTGNDPPHPRAGR